MFSSFTSSPATHTQNTCTMFTSCTSPATQIHTQNTTPARCLLHSLHLQHTHKTPARCLLHSLHLQHTHKIPHLHDVYFMHFTCNTNTHTKHHTCMMFTSFTSPTTHTQNTTPARCLLHSLHLQHTHKIPHLHDVYFVDFTCNTHIRSDLVYVSPEPQPHTQYIAITTNQLVSI